MCVRVCVCVYVCAPHVFTCRPCFTLISHPLAFACMSLRRRARVCLCVLLRLFMRITGSFRVQRMQQISVSIIGAALTCLCTSHTTWSLYHRLDGSQRHTDITHWYVCSGMHSSMRACNTVMHPPVSACGYLHSTPLLLHVCANDSSTQTRCTQHTLVRSGHACSNVYCVSRVCSCMHACMHARSIGAHA